MAAIPDAADFLGGDNMDWKDIGIRAGKTFLQAFLAIVIATKITSAADFLSPELLDQAFVAGVAAFLSFAQNVLTQLGSE